MTEDGRVIGPAIRVGAPEDLARDRVERWPLAGDKSAAHSGDAPAGTERGFYRLVGLGDGGLRAYDRQAFSTLERAEECRDQESRDLGIAWHSALPSGVVMLDGQWLCTAREATRYSEPLFGGEHPAHRDVGPWVASACIVVHVQPREWIGRLFLDAAGSGSVWSGRELLKVMDHRICDFAPEGYRGLYAWNVQATQELGSRLDDADRFALVQLTREQRARWRVSRIGEYAVFERPEEWVVTGRSEFIRRPWRAVALSARQLLELFEEDRLRPETEKPIYRAALLAPEGLVALGPEGYTSLEGALEVFKARGRAGTEVRAVTRCRGLPADLTRIDGLPFESGRLRIEPGAGSEVAWVDPAGAGVPVMDGNGAGFVLGRSRLVRVVDGLISERYGDGLSGAPAWIYRVFAKLRVEPLTRHVHSVVVKVTSEEAETWGLPDGTKAVLLLRGRSAGSVTWRCLDGEVLKSLRPEDAVSVSRRGGDVPAGVDAGTAGVGEG